jgi:hypothetical protein
MAKKIPASFYTERAEKLTRYGYKFPKKLSPVSKRLIRSTYKKHAQFLDAKDQSRVRFVRSNGPKEATDISQRTPSGFFVRIPKGVSPKRFKVRATEDSLRITTGKTVEEIRSLDPAGLAKDPLTEIKRVIGKRRPVKIRLMVYGNDGARIFSLSSFYLYSTILIPEILQGNAKKKGLTYSGLTRHFKLKLIYSNARSTRTKPRRKTRKKVRSN